MVLNHDLFNNSFQNMFLKNKTPNLSETVLLCFKIIFMV